MRSAYSRMKRCGSTPCQTRWLGSKLNPRAGRRPQFSSRRRAGEGGKWSCAGGAAHRLGRPGRDSHLVDGPLAELLRLALDSVGRETVEPGVIVVADAL